jgi:hypothetical protein
MISASAADKLASVHTILVVVEESENGQIQLKEIPATDGILDALWSYEQFIFFDMKVNGSFRIVNNELDASGFALQAKESGADAILLIKFGYTSKSDGEKIILTSGEIMYKLISLDRLDTVRMGKIVPDLNDNILKKEKYGRLKKIGDEILRKILN